MVEFPGSGSGGAGGRAYALGDSEAVVESLGGPAGLEDEKLETVVGAPPGVPQGLAGGDAPGKAVEVAAAKGLDGGGGVVAAGEERRQRRLGLGMEEEGVMPSHARRRHCH